VDRIGRHVVPIDVLTDLDHELFGVRDGYDGIDELIRDTGVLQRDQVSSIGPKIIALEHHPRLDRLVVHGGGGLDHVVDPDADRRGHTSRTNRHTEVGSRIGNLVLAQRFHAGQLILLNPGEGLTVDLECSDVRPTRRRQKGHDAGSLPGLTVTAQELRLREGAAPIFGEDEAFPALTSLGAHRAAFPIADKQLDRGDFALDVVRHLDAITGRAEAEETDFVLSPDGFPAADEGDPAGVHVDGLDLSGRR
jgi:hypothetical protein